MQKHKNAKERLSERILKFIWGRPSVSSFDDGTSKSKICGVLAENDACNGGHQKNSLHPSRRMAWKNLRHGVAVNFLSPRKKNTAVLNKQARSNKILQNKQK